MFGSTTALDAGRRKSSCLLQNLVRGASDEVKFSGKFVIWSWLQGGLHVNWMCCGLGTERLWTAGYRAVCM